MLLKASCPFTIGENTRVKCNTECALYGINGCKIAESLDSLDTIADALTDIRNATIGLNEG